MSQQDEGAHAVADTLLFRHVEYIELNWDATGGTLPKNQGGCLVSVTAAFVGYIGPSSFGLGAAKLIQLGYAIKLAAIFIEHVSTWSPVHA